MPFPRVRKERVVAPKYPLYNDFSASGGGSIDVIELDLATLEGVPACLDALVAGGRTSDVVINNASVGAVPVVRSTGDVDDAGIRGCHAGSARGLPACPLGRSGARERTVSQCPARSSVQ